MGRPVTRGRGSVRGYREARSESVASFIRQLEIGWPSHRAAVEHTAKPLLDGLRNSSQLRVVQSANQLPVTAPADAQRMYLKSVVWLVADILSSSENARNAIAHEVVRHYRRCGFFGSIVDPTFGFIHGANPNIQ